MLFSFIADDVLVLRLTRKVDITYGIWHSNYSYYNSQHYAYYKKGLHAIRLKNRWHEKFENLQLNIMFTSGMSTKYAL